MTDWQQRGIATLPAMPTAAFWARWHTTTSLQSWDVAHLVQLDEVHLVVSELVTNAVQASPGWDEASEAAYGQQPLSLTYTQLLGLSCVRLRLSYAPSSLLVEVWDRQPEPPKPQLPDFVSEDGRGLYLVAAYCEEWGWYPEQVGKVVWGQLAVAEAPSSGRPPKA